MFSFRDNVIRGHHIKIMMCIALRIDGVSPSIDNNFFFILSVQIKAFHVLIDTYLYRTGSHWLLRSVTFSTVNNQLRYYM